MIESISTEEWEKLVSEFVEREAEGFDELPANTLFEACERPQPKVEKRPWSEAFRDSAVPFVDQLIDKNRALFEKLARL